MDKERVKQHIKDNWVLYSSVVVGTIAGITVLVMRGRYEALVSDGAYGSKTADTSVTMRPLSFLATQKNIVNVITRNGRGHPGYLVYCEELGVIFQSQREAAELLAISPGVISKHVSGKIPDANGYHFQRVIGGN